MRLILISLSKCELLSFSFRFLNENDSYYHSYLAQGNCPALLCKSDIAPRVLRAGVYVRIRQFLVVCKSDPKNFYSVQIRQWIFPKTPAISNCVRILWGMCKSDMVFLGLRCANPTRFLWFRWEGVWLCGFGEKLREREKLGGTVGEAHVWCGAPDLRRFWGRVEKIWVNLRLEEIK